MFGWGPMHNTKTKFCENRSTGETNPFFVSHTMSVRFVIHYNSTVFKYSMHRMIHTTSASLPRHEYIFDTHCATKTKRGYNTAFN